MGKKITKQEILERKRAEKREERKIKKIWAKLKRLCDKFGFDITKHACFMYFRKICEREKAEEVIAQKQRELSELRQKHNL